MVKGDLCRVSISTVEGSYNGYFKRLWVSGSNGAPLADYEVGFEENYQKFKKMHRLDD